VNRPRGVGSMPSQRLAAAVLLAAIVACCALFLFAFATLLHGQVGPPVPGDAGLGQLVPSFSAQLAGLASVALTGYLVKGTTKADSWWQEHVVVKTKPVQPLIALGLSVGLAALGHKIGMPGLQDLNQALLQSPTATLTAIALREGYHAVTKTTPEF